MTGIERYTRDNPCPICGHYGNDPEGHCHGITSDDGEWARCTRADGSDGAMYDEEHSSPPAYVYRREGGSYRPWTERPPMQPIPVTKARAEAHSAPPQATAKPDDKTHPRPAGRRTYPYSDTEGVEAVRHVAGGKKECYPRVRDRADAPWRDGKGIAPKERIYHRADLDAMPDVRVYVVEGEGCADALHGVGASAITWRGGCGQVRKAIPQIIEAARGRDVVLLPDADGTGRSAMREIAMALRGVAKTVRIVSLYDDDSGRDAEDWLHEGGTVDRLTARIDATPAYEPEATHSAAHAGGMTLPELMRREFIPRREFVPGIITQGVTLLASKAKIGKTWLTLNTGLALACGGHAFGKIPVEQVGVLILSLEDGPQRLQDRFALLLDDKNPPENLHIFTEWPRLDAGGTAQLDEYLTEHPGVKVIFIDTLAKIRPARRKGGDLYAEDYAIGETLKVIAERHGVAIVLVYHTRKASADDPLDEIRDTMGLTGGVDNCLVLRRARGQADAELFVSGRDIAEEKGYALAWDKITTQWIIAGDASEYAVSTARKQVLDALEGAPDGLTPTETARKVDKPLSAVKKLMWTMSKDDTLIVSEGRYQKHGNRGNPVTVTPGTLAEQGKLDTATVTSRLPSVALGNRESNRGDNAKGSNSKENDSHGYRVTTVTAVVANDPTKIDGHHSDETAPPTPATIDRLFATGDGAQ